MQDIDIDIEGLFDTIIQLLINVFIWNNDPNAEGILEMIYNWLPVLGNNSLSIEIWFYISFFGGFYLFMRYFGTGIIIKTINYGLDKL